MSSLMERVERLEQAARLRQQFCNPPRVGLVLDNGNAQQLAASIAAEHAKLGTVAVFSVHFVAAIDGRPLDCPPDNT